MDIDRIFDRIADFLADDARVSSTIKAATQAYIHGSYDKRHILEFAEDEVRVVDWDSRSTDLSRRVLLEISILRPDGDMERARTNLIRFALQEAFVRGYATFGK